jgi:hypothetical protein
MKLETANTGVNEATADDVRRILSDWKARGEYAILLRDKETFIQVAGELDGPFVVEYRQEGKQYRADGEFDLATIERDFLSYLAGTSVWKDSHHWHDIKAGMGCLSGAALIMIGLIAFFRTYFT